MITPTPPASVPSPDSSSRSHHDESLVPAYTVPNPLRLADGSFVTTREDWIIRRRPELLDLFATHMYGRIPASASNLKNRYEITDTHSAALGGQATRRQITIHFGSDPNFPKLFLLLYLPNNVTAPVPVFLVPNFHGNHTVHNDPGITLPTAWMRNDPIYGVTDNRASAAGRGANSSRWPVEAILARGYGLATAYYGDVFPDHPSGRENSILPFLAPDPGAPAAPAAIAAWSWAISRAADYLISDRAIDAYRLCLTGHSRLGKAVLWAGAQDTRFGLIISNCSGCCGAAFSRRQFGETFAVINQKFPHWFTPRFHSYSGKESDFPADQHELLALLTPRPLLVCSAQDDAWADPMGEYVSTLHATPVYQLFGKSGPISPQPPNLDTLFPAPLSYHIRAGKHDVLHADWQTYINFAQTYLARK